MPPTNVSAAGFLPFITPYHRRRAERASPRGEPDLPCFPGAS